MNPRFSNPVQDRIFFDPFYSFYRADSHPFREHRQHFQHRLFGRMLTVKQRPRALVETFTTVPATIALASLATFPKSLYASVGSAKIGALAIRATVSRRGQG